MSSSCGSSTGSSRATFATRGREMLSRSLDCVGQHLQPGGRQMLSRSLGCLELLAESEGPFGILVGSLHGPCRVLTSLFETYSVQHNSFKTQKFLYSTLLLKDFVKDLVKNEEYM